MGKVCYIKSVGKFSTRFLPQLDIRAILMSGGGAGNPIMKKNTYGGIPDGDKLRYHRLYCKLTVRKIDAHVCL